MEKTDIKICQRKNKNQIEYQNEYQKNYGDSKNQRKSLNLVINILK